MSLPIPERFRLGVESLSPSLCSLLAAELASGNRIKKVESGDPAPSGGVWVMLAKPVSTRVRATGDGLTFWLESSSEYMARLSIKTLAISFSRLRSNRTERTQTWTKFAKR